MAVATTKTTSSPLVALALLLLTLALAQARPASFSVGNALIQWHSADRSTDAVVADSDQDTYAKPGYMAAGRTVAVVNNFGDDDMNDDDDDRQQRRTATYATVDAADDDDQQQQRTATYATVDAAAYDDDDRQQQRTATYANVDAAAFAAYDDNSEPDSDYPPPPQSGAVPVPEPVPSPESGAVPEPEPVPAPELGAEPESVPSPESGAGPVPAPELGAEPEFVPSPESGAGPVPSPESGAEPESVPSPESGAGPVPSPESGAGPVPSPESGEEPVPSPESGEEPVPAPESESASVTSETGAALPGTPAWAIPRGDLENAFRQVEQVLANVSAQALDVVRQVQLREPASPLVRCAFRVASVSQDINDSLRKLRQTSPDGLSAAAVAQAQQWVNQTANAQTTCASSLLRAAQKNSDNTSAANANANANANTNGALANGVVASASDAELQRRLRSSYNTVVASVYSLYRIIGQPNAYTVLSDLQL